MPNNSPLDQYQALVSSKQIRFDAQQQHSVELLQQLYLTLQSSSVNKTHKHIKVKGIYLWGKVGRGKTFLMDLLVNSLEDTLCKRQHFHHFMQDVHAQLNGLSSKKLSGKQNPLNLIAKNFAKQYKVLCFDEFFVSDIGDAMLLGNLLQYLFELNVIVVSTSNCAPQELYKNGLQRARFLPAIAAIEKHTQVLHLNGLDDHRHRTLTPVQNYFELPKSAEQQILLHQKLLHRFNLSEGKSGVIKILNRNINCMAKSIEGADNCQKNHVICFEFSELCQGARSHFDYIELAKHFNSILLFNLPPMSGQAYERIKARGTEDNGSNINVSSATTGEREVVLAPMDDAARRFIALVDECYDCHVNLVISAYVPQGELYNSGTLLFEFERTKSRLVEMGSLEYLNRSTL